eukprot:COSAG06_NODE_3307_length_5528_cov_105.042918_5_plen_129_part_00
MVLSRSFTVHGEPRLLPFVDLLNHHPDAGEIVINTGSSFIHSPSPSANTSTMRAEQHEQDGQTASKQEAGDEQPEGIDVDANAEENGAKNALLSHFILGMIIFTKICSGQAWEKLRRERAGRRRKFRS